MTSGRSRHPGWYRVADGASCRRRLVSLLALVACTSAGCSLTLDYAPTEVCDNGVDDDGDGRADCADTDCLGEACEEIDGLCDDGIDNDLDAATDAADFGCWFKPRRLQVGRCTSVPGTRLDTTTLLRPEQWEGDDVSAEGDALRAPAVTGPFEVRGRSVLLGSEFGEARGDPGTELRATLALASGFRHVVLGLSVSPEVPGGISRPVLLVLDRSAPGELVVGLEVGPDSGGPERRAIPDDAELVIDARLALADPVAPADECPLCAAGTRVDVAIAAGDASVEPVSLYIEGEPAQGPFPRRLLLRGDADAGSIALRALEVSRPSEDSCSEALPYRSLDDWQEVHSLTADDADGRRRTLCATGYASASREGPAGVIVAAGSLDPADLTPLEFGTAVPRWTAAYRAPTARYGVVGHDAQTDRESFILVTQAEAGDRSSLALATSEDCLAWSALAPLTLEGFTDAVLRDRVGPDEPLALVPIGIGMLPVPSLRLLRSSAERDGALAVLSCAIDVPRRSCVYVETTDTPLLLRSLPGARGLPEATTVAVGNRWAFLDGAAHEGALSLSEYNGTGIESFDDGSRVDALLDGSTLPGTFDAYVFQGAMWLASEPEQRPNREFAALPGWVLYTAGAARDAPRHVGAATVRLLLD